MKRNKIVIIGLVVLLIMLICDMIYSIVSTMDYEKRKESGNERWFQVENRIIQYEEKVNKIEEEIELWNK